MGIRYDRVVGLFAALLFTFAGCSAQRIDLVVNGAICVDLRAPLGVSLESLQVYREGSDLEVEGAIDRSGPVPRQVALELIGVDGVTLDSQTVRVTHAGQHSPRIHFSAKMNGNVPLPARLRISF